MTMSVPLISWCLVIVIAVVAMIMRFMEHFSNVGHGPHGLRLEHRKVTVETEKTVRQHTDKN